MWFDDMYASDSHTHHMLIPSKHIKKVCFSLVHISTYHERSQSCRSTSPTFMVWVWHGVTMGIKKKSHSPMILENNMCDNFFEVRASVGLCSSSFFSWDPNPKWNVRKICKKPWVFACISSQRCKDMAPPIAPPTLSTRTLAKVRVCYGTWSICSGFTFEKCWFSIALLN